MRQINIALDIYSIIISVILALYLFRRREKSRDIFYFRLMCIFNLGMVLGDLTDWTCRGQAYPWLPPLLHIGTFVNYISATPMLWATARYVQESLVPTVTVSKMYDRILAVLCAVYLLGCLITPITGMYYIITPDNQYVRGELFMVSQSIPFLMYIIIAVMAIHYWKYFRLGAFLSTMSYVAIPLIAQLIQIPNQGLNVLCPAITLGILICFVNIQTDREIQRQKDRKELMQAQIMVMISQIQPHFLYNALNTIRRLCDVDPQRAREAVDDFSVFLRANMDSLSNHTPIPFEQELRHTQSYLNLEQKRFGEGLRVEYDIQATGFFLPALTLQPIVENAVKHGIRRKGSDGTVTIRSEESSMHFMVTVSDNGAGFDMDQPMDNQRPHIGIRNVQRRLAMLCGGELAVESEPGCGTIVTMLIPKGGGNENELSCS